MKIQNEEGLVLGKGREERTDSLFKIQNEEGLVLAELILVLPTASPIMLFLVFYCSTSNSHDSIGLKLLDH
jgi:hypothetical protein